MARRAVFKIQLFSYIYRAKDSRIMGVGRWYG